MLVSAIICAHNVESYENLREAIASLLQQTHRDLEIVVVSDGSQQLYQRVLADYAHNQVIRGILLTQSAGVSAARNAGITVAQGDVIAFMDDDAVADRTWIKQLLHTYQQYDAVAVGGRILPIWLSERPDYLPEELYWLVGVTHDGFAEEEGVELRNAFGSNMSFKREVFDRIGLLNQSLGFARNRTSYVQAEEPEFALRMRQAFGRGVVYCPDAIVYHKVPHSKLALESLVRRSFYQGYSKAILRKLNISADAMAAERSYLRMLLLKRIPRRIVGAYDLTEIKKLNLLVACVVSVGLGFFYGYVRGTRRSDQPIP